LITRELALRSDTKQLGNEERLRDGFVFGQLSHSSFPNHKDCFDALQRFPHTLKRAVTLASQVRFFTVR
jgi:hypothetical protein